MPQPNAARTGWRRACIGLIPLLSMLAACRTNTPTRSTTPPVEQTATLTDLQNAQPEAPRNTEISTVRFIALRDSALSLGARSGLYAQSQTLNRVLMHRSRILERIFNFQPVLLPQHVLPPVLIAAQNTLEQRSADTLRIADRSYAILEQARFVTAVPTWRDYLWLTFEKPEDPHPSMLPKNGSERLIWERYIAEGWLAGIEQARTVLAENLGKLKRDLEGMLRYRTLLAQHMVSAPFVARMDMGVTGGGDQMSVNDRVLRITALPTLNATASEWQSRLPLPETDGDPAP